MDKFIRFMSSILGKAAVSMVVISASCGVLAGAVVYDAFDGFSGKSNPNGVWQYGYKSSLLGTDLILYNTPIGLSCEVDGLQFWRSNYHAPDPNIGRNPYTAASAVNHDVLMCSGGVFLPSADYLHVHPGPNGEFSVLRFTPPQPGVYRITAAFKSLKTMSPATTDVHIAIPFRNKEVLRGKINGIITTQNIRFRQTYRLSEADFIDFEVGYGDNLNYFGDSTGLRVCIQAGDLLVTELCR